jgi:hypothetical protein
LREHEERGVLAGAHTDARADTPMINLQAKPEIRGGLENRYTS